MNIKELRLELHDIADELDAVVYNDWLVGDVTPFRDKARRLRNVARELAEITVGNGPPSGGEQWYPKPYPTPSDHLRDELWPQR